MAVIKIQPEISVSCGKSAWTQEYIANKPLVS